MKFSISQWIQAIQGRLYKKGQILDYPILAAYATLPVWLSLELGAGFPREANGVFYSGYLNSWNWLAFILLLPTTLWLFRFTTSSIAPLHPSKTGPAWPAIIDIIKNDKMKKSAFEEFKDISLNTKNFISIFLLAIGINLIDSWEVLMIYRSHQTESREPDWSVMFQANPDLGMSENIILVALAYSNQIIVTIMALLVIAFSLNHNLFFLKRIYQRRWNEAKGSQEAIVIDLNDRERCFGFRAANEAFNTQVLVLFVAGVCVLLTRFKNVSIAQSDSIYQALSSLPGILKLEVDQVGRLLQGFDWTGLFPDIGQIIIASLWLTFLLIVSLPAFVKMLPRIGPQKISKYITTYLQEFIPSQDWPYSDEPTVEEVDEIAAKFASNSFWPTGDNRAAVLFFFSFFVFFVILSPLHYKEGQTFYFLTYYIFLSILAAAATAAIFKLLKTYLSYIDPRLVKSADS